MIVPCPECKSGPCGRFFLSWFYIAGLKDQAQELVQAVAVFKLADQRSGMPLLGMN